MLASGFRVAMSTFLSLLKVRFINNNNNNISNNNNSNESKHKGAQHVLGKILNSFYVAIYILYITILEIRYLYNFYFIV